MSNLPILLKLGSLSVSRGHSERAFLFLEYPTFGHLIRIALSIGILAISQSWLILSKKPLMSPSSIHCARLQFASTIKHCPAASCLERAVRNPQQFGSSNVSAMGSSASLYKAWNARSPIRGIPKGLFFGVFLGYVDASKGQRLIAPLRHLCYGICL